MDTAEISKQLDTLHQNGLWLEAKTKQLVQAASRAKTKSQKAEARKRLLEIKARNLRDLRDVEKLIALIE
jgi:hypothetical protein